MNDNRPERRYRERFRSLVLGDEPSSLLDVGCGGGTMLRWMQETGVVVEGLEADPGLVAKMRGDGHTVHEGRGEELPFADGAFDVVA